MDRKTKQLISEIGWYSFLVLIAIFMVWGIVGIVTNLT